MCGQVFQWPLPDPELRVMGGDTWPDFIHASSTTRNWYVSERVVAYMRSHPAFQCEFLPLGKVLCTASSLDRRLMPTYFDIRIKLRIPFDLDDEMYDPDLVCGVCGRALRSGVAPKQFPQPLFTQWDKEGLAVEAIPRKSVIYCGWSFVQLAREHRWTGIAFYPHPGKQIGELAPFAVDYLADQWPPTKWFIRR